MSGEVALLVPVALAALAAFIFWWTRAPGDRAHAPAPQAHAPVPSAPEILAAAGDPARARQIAQGYSTAGLTTQFIEELRAAPARTLSVYAAALVELYEYRTAQALLRLKPSPDPADYPILVAALNALNELADFNLDAVPDHHRVHFALALTQAGHAKLALRCLVERRALPLAADDYILAMRLCHQMDNFNLADRLFREGSAVPAAAAEPEFSYQFALCCEKDGKYGRAREVYQSILGSNASHRDCRERLKSLQEAAPPEFSRVDAFLGSVKAASAARAEAAPGTGAILKEKFEIREPLGAGGMGMVYKGWDRTLMRDVAIKKMHAAITLNEALRERFVREARVVANLTHPYIVAIHDIVIVDKEVYLIFEYVDGETLSEAVDRKGPFAPAECVRMLSRVCEALSYAHEKGIIHRDLKSPNIMLNAKGYPKVMDFGLARTLDTQTSAGADGRAIGTPAYMAPEQHAGEASPQSDLYSLGVTAYELLAGRLPFPGPDYLSQKERHAFAPLPPAVPENLRRLITQCLACDPRSRPSGTSEILAQLLRSRP